MQIKILFELVSLICHMTRRGASFKIAKLTEKNQAKISVNHSFCYKNRQKYTSSSAYKYL